jgi:hypothetical protein
MMLQITKLLHNPHSVKVLSFLVGMGVVVLLLHRPIQTQTTLGLPVAEIEGVRVEQDGKCYAYRAEDTACEISGSR